MRHLHIGAHKTATTHLQQSLRAHLAALGQAGITYLDPTELRGPETRLGFIAAGGEGALEHGRALRARLHQVPRLLMSEENIAGNAHDPAMLAEGRFYPEAEIRLARVLAAVPGGPVRLFLAVRDPAGFLTSAYCQRLFGGEILSFDEFSAGCDPARLRWSELVARLVALREVAGCVVWRFEDWPAVAPAVLSQLLPVDLAGSITMFEGISHPGLSQRGHDWVMEMMAAGQAGPEIARKARRRFPKSQDAPGLQPYDAGMQARSARAYAQDMDDLARIPGIHVIAPGADTGAG